MFTELLIRYPALHTCEDSILHAFKTLTKLYENGGKLLLCGNGGSASDCDHIVGELCKGFLKMRRLPDTMREEMQKNCPALSNETLNKLQCGLPAISLPTIPPLNAAFANDVDPDLVFAQGVLALAKPNDCLFAITTSGNSKNVLHACRVAKGLGLTVIGLTGAGGGELASLADICICVPEKETFKVQELHLPVYHALCAMLEAELFPS